MSNETKTIVTKRPVHIGPSPHAFPVGSTIPLPVEQADALIAAGDAEEAPPAS